MSYGKADTGARPNENFVKNGRRRTRPVDQAKWVGQRGDEQHSDADQGACHEDEGKRNCFRGRSDCSGP